MVFGIPFVDLFLVVLYMTGFVMFLIEFKTVGGSLRIMWKAIRRRKDLKKDSLLIVVCEVLSFVALPLLFCALLVLLISLFRVFNEERVALAMFVVCGGLAFFMKWYRGKLNGRLGENAKALVNGSDCSQK